MKNAPKEFPADFPDIDLLKYRSYIVSGNISDKSVTSGKYIKHIMEMLTEMQPFIGFLNRAISNG